MQIASRVGTFQGRSLHLIRWWSLEKQIVQIWRRCDPLLTGHSRLTCPGTPQLKQMAFIGHEYIWWPTSAQSWQGLKSSSEFGQFAIMWPIIPQWLHFLDISRSQYLFSFLMPPLLFLLPAAAIETLMVRPSNECPFIFSTNVCAMSSSSNTMMARPVDCWYSSKIILALITGPINSQTWDKASVDVP